MTETLLARVVEHPLVRVRPHSPAEELLVEGGRIVGVRSGEQRYEGRAVVLATGGYAGLWSRTTNTSDPVFAQFSRLAASGYPVAKQLAREKEVSDEALYALGFRLIESSDGRNEELGAELLQGIIDERPRSKLAKAAKNKLKLTGHSDD